MKLPAAVRLLRPGHWIKNLFCFSGVIFSKQLDDAEKLAFSARTFAAFCVLSSAIYVLNDLADRDKDRLHPAKRDRPLASGAVPPAAAWVLVLLLLAGAALVAGLPEPLTPATVGTLGAFVLLQCGYSMGLKHVVILDCLIVAVGFTLRAMAGAFAIGEQQLSPWLVVCSLLVALFLAFSKRRSELAALPVENGGEQVNSRTGELPAGAGEGAPQRPVLQSYSLRFLDQMIAITAAVTILAYILYTVDDRTVEGVHRHLIYTSPLVLFGILRYLYIVYRKGTAESPARALATDFPMVATFLAWCALVYCLLYIFPSVRGPAG